MKIGKAKPKPRSSEAADIEMGKRIRELRLEQNMSQSELGDRLGISFQQVQKYEKGINRVNANRLAVIASALKVRPESLFQAEDMLPDVSSLIDVTDEGVVRMLRAWSRITDQDTQREFVVLVETIAAATDK